MIRKTNFFPDELIGEEIEILTSQNKNDVGIKGKVVDETRATIKVEHLHQRKILLKNNITFRLIRSGRILKGQDLLKRTEERIKN